jgi:hypothetical protein
MITLTGNDPEGCPLSFFISNPPSHGSLSRTDAGPDVTYTPDPNYYGTDSFIFYINDGMNNSGEAFVAINIRAVNDPPVAVDDIAATVEDTSVTINVLANDSDVEGHVLQVWSVTNPGHGMAVVIMGTAIAYFPDADYSGVDSFEYTVSDGTDTANAKVSITVTPLNDAPTAYGQSVVTDEDTPLTITLTGSDIEGSPLSYTVTSQPSHGGVTIIGTGPDATYTPDANYNGPDSFAFKANDGMLDSNIATVSITVNAVNDAPDCFR